MTDGAGTVSSLATSEVLAATDSLERTFLEAVEASKLKEERVGGSVYVVVGPDASPEFRSKVSAVCSLVVDEGADGVALILSGSPEEWEGLAGNGE